MRDLRVLVVEDSEADYELVLAALRRDGGVAAHERVQDGEGLRAALAQQRWDVVISDWAMPAFSAPEALEVLRESGLDLPFIIVSGTIGEHVAVEAMRNGAHDYLLKDHLLRLRPAVDREVRESRIRESRRRTADALLASEARYRRVVETINQGVWLLDAEGRTTFMNARMAEMLQVSAGEMVGRPPDEFLDDEGRAQLLRKIDDHRVGVATQVEVRYRRRDGTFFWAILETSPMLAVDGRYEGSFAMVQDISERKRAEEALRDRVRISQLTVAVGIELTRGGSLREALQRCAEVIVAHLGTTFARIWTLDAAADVLELQASAGLYTHVDGPHARVTVGKFRIGLIAQERRPHLTNDVQHDPRIGDPEWARREGMVAFAGFPLLVGGEVVGVIAVFAREHLDETVRKGLESVADVVAIAVHAMMSEERGAGLEEQLRQAQKMEAVGRLAGGVAHDFNNVLSVILSHAEFVLADLSSGRPADEEDIEQIQKAGLRASELTRQLLMFSRQHVVEPRVLDLNEVLWDLDKMLQRILGEDIDCVLVTAPQLSKIKADRGGLEQVLMNLVVNARDAMPTGGKLTIETADVTLDQGFAADHVGVRPGEYVMLAVTDTGSGMDAATRSRIFEPFFTTKEKGKGTGLGLSTVFGIVQQSDGTIWVYSDPGVGTTFKIYLPASRTEAAADARSSSTVVSNPRGTETILLVEDEEAVRQVARSILERQGFEVIVARNGGEALEKCETHAGPIHLLLTDVVMPLMSGPELARRVMQRRPGTKVIFMSGYTDDSIFRHGILEQELAFLQKPFTPSSLTAKVREILDAR